ncbi:MAG TPA: hypothetical protein VGX95_04100 [Xanthobacteraceae bacterium]|nr:hypothetical protein [Xanthobacteraceae bacterium]
MTFSALGRCATIVAACLLSAPAFADVVRSHSFGCYERADLEFISKYFRFGIINTRESCFTIDEEREVTVLRRVDVDLPIEQMALVQPKDGGRPFWVPGRTVGAPLPKITFPPARNP